MTIIVIIIVNLIMIIIIMIIKYLSLFLSYRRHGEGLLRETYWPP